MTDFETTPQPRRRSRWRPLIVFALLMVLSAATLFAWILSQETLSDEERHLVGRWAFQWDHHPENLGVEYDFRADRMCRIRNYDPKTGAFMSESADVAWRLRGSALIFQFPDIRPRSFWHLSPSEGTERQVIILAPDGPDRFRYTSTVAPSPGHPPITGTMTRVTP